ncbi:hypothetical protein NRY68_17610 [Acidithiobacillus ferrooxidans]|uniref:secretion/conjugation apparatus DotM-related subunit n=1 Tax=Acidithiobacillus ferrooxidans TaxID=920 RepID=UPI0021474EE4|nr:hypothetical protein [Acidithiobacillus ferrooxidans]MCR1347571.1 hypothetical protein [Acidithiobacillus ferrooxidans]MCR1355729.1 hypothetical protein [Acidithiobacillus ferrooxidans]
MAASNQQGSQGQSSSSDDFMLTFFIIIILFAAIIYFGKDIIIAYWKGMRLLDFWILGKVSPSFSHDYDNFILWKFLLHHPIAKTSWNAAAIINARMNRDLSIGPFQPWPIFWSLLPAALAIPLWNRGKNLKKTFSRPWDLALYMKKQYPWMLPVIRQRSAALKNQFKIPKKRNLSALLVGLVQRVKSSDWPLHPLTILLNAGAFAQDEHGEWCIQEAPVEQWAKKQIGAMAGRSGFSTPERNALFHAFVSKDCADILKTYAAGGDKTIQKQSALDAKDTERFQAYRKNHAYEVGILLSALRDARKKTIVPPNWFVWLKYRDRALWYALHGLGLPRPHPEGLPGLVQWHCELRLESPVAVIQTQFVKSGLWDALEEIQWKKSKEWQDYVRKSQ